MATIPVQIKVDCASVVSEYRPIYRFWGADEPNYAYMKDGKKLLKELGAIGKPTKFFRTHNLLTTGDGTPALKWGSTNAYTEDAQGNPIYDWTIVDRIFDAYLEHGVRPYVQIGFMPEAMSIAPQPYRHHWGARDKYADIFTGWAHPPKDYAKWGELAYQWAKHCVEKYGKAEVETWYWEVWNEPNIPYWQGSCEEFQKLHDYAIAGVRRALPTAKVGGPDTAGGGGDWLREFLDHCLKGKNFATGEIGTPTDFLAFHAKGDPKVVDGHIRMGISAQLKTIDETFALIASYPELKPKPIVIGESDPEGCAACQGPQFGYRNGVMYSSYTAASFVRKMDLALKHGVNLEGALTWAFEFEDQPYFAGFRVMATNGIDLPVLNVFRMFGLMDGDRVKTESSHQIALDDIVKAGVREQPDIGVLATVETYRREGDRTCVFLWHYHEDDLPGDEAEVSVTLTKPSPGGKISCYAVDQTYSNAYTKWQSMGSPEKPTAEQYDELEKSGQLAQAEAPKIAWLQGEATFDIKIPRHGVKLVVIES